MKTSSLLTKFTLLTYVASTLGYSTLGYSTHIKRIIKAAEADSIDLFALPFVDTAFASIDEIYCSKNLTTVANFTSATKIDVHMHAVPDWYRALVPLSGQNPTPAWDIQTAFQFMASNGITHGILSLPIPSAFPGNSTYSVGVARLVNEWLAALAKVHPERFSHYAYIPLPYVDAATKEATYGLDTLGALGCCVTTNHEGLYLGNPLFKPFFAALQSRNSSREIVFIHPQDPFLRDPSNNTTLIEANPTVYPAGFVEFFFETARTLNDLTSTQTILNFTKIHWSIPHVGGAFPSIIDRFLPRTPALVEPSENVYNTRFWYDSAGSTYPHQVLGLLAYGVPTTQLVFGSDYPFAPYPYAMAIENIVQSTFLSETEKNGIYFENVRSMFQGGCGCGH